MDANTTAAVDILIRTSAGNVSADFNRALDRMKSDATKWAREMKGIFATVGGGMFGGGGTGKNDPAMQKAMQDIQQMQRQRFKMEADLSKQLAKESEVQRDNRVSAFKASMNQIEKEYVSAGQKAAEKAKSSNGIFSATFWGTLAGNIAANFMAKLAQIPSMIVDFVKDSFDKALNLDSQIKALAQFEGSVEKANDRVAKLIDVANKTPGLRFDSAVQGQLRLEAVGFQADKATSLLEGLAKVRVLSNTSQQDFDIMITELAKFSAGGEKVGIIFRELANHMPALIQLMTKEFGHLNEETVKKAGGPQQFLEKLIETMQKINPQFNSAGLAVENVSDAWDRLKISVGRILEQNPDVIAAIESVTNLLNKNTTALSKNENQAHKTADSWVSSFAKMTVSTVNFIDIVSQEYTNFSEMIGKMMNTIVQGVNFDVLAVMNGINKIVDGANLVLTVAAQIPGSPTFGSQYQFPTFKGASDTDVQGALTGAMDARSQWWKSVFKHNEGYDRANQRWQDFATNRAAVTNQPQGDNPFLGLKNPGNTEDLEGDAAKKAKKIFEPSGDAKTLIEAAARLGIKPLDLATIIAYETKGTFSPTIKGGAGDAYTGLVQFGPEEYSKYHVGQNLTFSSQLMNSVVPFLQDRFGQVGKQTAGASLADLYRTVLGGNPNVPLTAKDQHGTIAQHLLRMTGNARTQALTKFFGGAESNIKTSIGGIDINDFAEEERKLRATALVKRIGDTYRSDLTAQPAQLGTSVGLRPNLDQQYIARLKDSLNTEELITDTILQQRNADEEISTIVQHQIALLTKAQTQNAIDLEVARKRNTEQEAYVKLQQSYTEQVNERKDIERDLSVLEQQNSDAGFVTERRRNEAVSERFNLEKQITALQDEYSTVDVNQELRIQAALLKDIVDLRYKESDAIIARNKAILDIQEQTKYSASQADTKVLEFMASQKGVTEAMGDFKVGLIQSGYDVIDKGLDKILPKMGLLTNAVHDLLSSFIKLIVNKGFRALFGLDTPALSSGGARSGGGGGIGNMFTNFLFGGMNGSNLAGSSVSSGGGSLLSSAGAVVPSLSGFGGVGIGGGNIFGGPSTSGYGGGGGLGGLLGLGGGLSGIGSSDISLGGAPTSIGAGPFSIGMGGMQTLGGGARQLTGIRGLLSSKAFQTQLAGAMVGGSLGVGLGGQSIGGQVLGGVGGAIGGTLLTGLITSGSVSGATTGGIFGSTAGLFGLSGAATFGIGLAIAGGLMLASYLFGRSKRRAQEKKQVNQLSGDAMTQIQQLIDQVKTYKIDGASALQQGTAIRDQYSQQVAALKTGPGKRLAQEKLGQINALLDTLKQEGQKADMAQAAATALDEKVVPTFATGGVSMFTGMTSGAMPIVVHGNEAVINQSQIMALGGYRRLRDVGVPGINLSGAPDNYNSTVRRPTVNGVPTGGGNTPNITVVAVYDENAADDLIAKASPHGVAMKVRMGVHNGNDSGLMDTITQKLVDG